MTQIRTGSTTVPTPRTSRPPKKPLCTCCGAADPEDFQVLSRHRTAVGTTVWLRCSCTALQVRVVTGAGVQIVARGRRPDGTPVGV